MIRINLLPVREAKKRASGKQFLLLAVVLILLEVGVLFYWQTVKDADLAQVSSQNAKIEADAKVAEEKTASVAQNETVKAELERQKGVLDTLTEGQTGPVRMLDELAGMLTPVKDPVQKLAMQKRGWNPDWDPKRLWIDTFIEKNRSVKIAGHARSNDDLAEFLQRLKTSKHFVNDKLNVSELVELQELGEAKVVRFNIDAIALYGPADVQRLARGELGGATK